MKIVYYFFSDEYEKDKTSKNNKLLKKYSLKQ